MVCCFKLVAKGVRGGVWQFVYDTNRSISPDPFPRMLVFYCHIQTARPTPTTFAAYLKQHTISSSNHVTSLDSTSINSPIPPSPQQHLESLISLFYSTAEESYSAGLKASPLLSIYSLQA